MGAGFGEGGQLIGVEHAGQAHAAEEQNQAPGPAALQVGEELEKVADAEERSRTGTMKAATPKSWNKVKASQAPMGPPRLWGELLAGTMLETESWGS